MLAIDGEGGAGERGGAERRFVQSRARILETPAIAREHFDISEQMMAEGDGLRRLQMGEARHDAAGFLQRLLGEGELEIGQLRVDVVDRVANVEAEIGRHLIVARARRMQPSGHRADRAPRAATSTFI